MPFDVDIVPFEVPLAAVRVTVRPATEADAVAWQRDWSETLHRMDADDATWDWSRQIARATSESGFLCLAAATEKLEGLLSLSFGVSRVSRAERLIYVEYIATAPWNRRLDGPKLRGVGRLLIQAAIRASVELGLKGRIGLHAKPAVERFYRDKLGLVDLGTEVVEDGKWVYFEATPVVARRIL